LGPTKLRIAGRGQPKFNWALILHDAALMT
jgi:hypothetical protein